MAGHEFNSETPVMLEGSIPVSGKTVPFPKGAQARFTKLVTPRNADTVRRKIEVAYGFAPSEKYCRDLIAFTEAMLAGPTDKQDG